ncbi:MAG: hypothetical protein JSW60_08485 [Thermoplasmatales archaeon]|nr:MAG: hypothetical protein JSW60_08485 [Thermoplasmatales archaeon]
MRKIIVMTACIVMLMLVIPISSALSNQSTVTLQVTNGVNTINKVIPTNQYNRILELFDDIYYHNKKDGSLTDLQKKLPELAYELELAGLISENSYLFKRLTKNPFEDMNYLNLIIGVGTDTIIMPLRCNFLGLFMFPFTLIVEVLLELDIISTEQWLRYFDLLDFLQYQRPRVVIPYGFWGYTSGWITTIGLNGIKEYDDGMFLLRGFMGLGIGTFDTSLERGFIIGFTLTTNKLF